MSGCSEATLQRLIDRVYQVASDWWIEEESTDPHVDKEDRYALRAIADGFRLLSSSKSLDALEPLLKLISPLWDGSEPFYFRGTEDHSVIFAGDFAIEAEEFYKRSGGRPNADSLPTQKAVQSLIEIWVDETKTPATKPTAATEGRVMAFYRLLLPLLVPPPGPGPVWRARLAFSKQCLRGLPRGIDTQQKAIRLAEKTQIDFAQKAGGQREV